MRGLIVRGVGGFYYVRPERAPGEAGGGYGEGVYMCRARGIFKKDGLVPTVGDVVYFEATEGAEGVVNGIRPRKNLFARPPIANVDCFVAVASAARPAPNLEIMDRFLTVAEMARAEVIICVNKADLSDSDPEGAGGAALIARVYGGIYPVLETSCVDGRGLERLPGLLMGKTSALAGASGVGKSTLLNALQRGLALETGEVSARTSRGRHTTRHVELFEMDFGGMVFDTPGFSSFEAALASPGAGGAEAASGLAACYPEMLGYAGKCRFDDCRHIREPGCAVLDAVRDGAIAPSRYESYARQHLELMKPRHRTR
ncbi:MAG: ribosome small subunit-dependent GTPase A [Clostridiales Family XIII bacterium]|jgi:ribosome biogenesis GTPase|nr:ribosome small subunit-dependent GTPase A [Clostridiales Family XIII bacterium]